MHSNSNSLSSSQFREREKERVREKYVEGVPRLSLRKGKNLADLIVNAKPKKKAGRVKGIWARLQVMQVHGGGIGGERQKGRDEED